MDWIHKFQLFLFDFDGLLVNTEPLHYQAYVNALVIRGHQLTLSFANFLELAHLSGAAWREAVLREVPDWDWKEIYEGKKEAYLELLNTGKVELMPGAEKLLRKLEKEGIQRSVVTHSILAHVAPIRARIEALQSIPHWITREDYEQPKPSPDGYLKAIELFGKKGDRIIGFEDSIRGLKALQGTSALPVLICKKHHPLLEVAAGGALHFESLDQVFT
jgi:HAD superfamily hydrolase (TIGR01509 family)